ncbi:MAG: hypothetical protein ACQETH_11405 [Candidatus Rifleibacteriota bacterium]
MKKVLLAGVALTIITCIAGFYFSKKQKRLKEFLSDKVIFKN